MNTVSGPIRLVFICRMFLKLYGDSCEQAMKMPASSNKRPGQLLVGKDETGMSRGTVASPDPCRGPFFAKFTHTPSSAESSKPDSSSQHSL